MLGREEGGDGGRGACRAMYVYGYGQGRVLDVSAVCLACIRGCRVLSMSMSMQTEGGGSTGCDAGTAMCFVYHPHTDWMSNTTTLLKGSNGGGC